MILNKSGAVLQSSGASDAGLVVIFWGVYLAFVLAIIAGNWMVFRKAGEPGWAVIVPIYNIYVSFKVAGMDWWWLLVMLVPFIGVFPPLLIPFGIAQNFEKGFGYGLGLLLLPFVFYPLLGFGEARFTGTKGAGI